MPPESACYVTETVSWYGPGSTHPSRIFAALTVPQQVLLSECPPYPDCLAPTHHTSVSMTPDQQERVVHCREVLVF